VPFQTPEYDLSGTIQRVGATEQQGTATERTVTLQLTGVSPDLAAAIEPGATETTAGTTVAEITSVDRTASSVILTSDDGNIHDREHPVNQDLTLEATLSVRETTTGTTFKGETIQRGSTITLDLGDHRLPEDVRELVEDYQALKGARSPFMWKWVHRLAPANTLPCVRSDYDEKVPTDKTITILFVTLLDDVLEKRRDRATFRAVSTIPFEWQSTDEENPDADADYVAFAERVWSDVDTDSATLVVETAQTVEADRDAVAFVLHRLLENAVTHGGDGVTVTVGDADGGFYVADDGPGIPATDRDRVFEQGYGTTPHGEGYGLFVAGRIARANGWEITLTESEAGGARFDVHDR
jgi:hypothetical protein